MRPRLLGWIAAGWLALAATGAAQQTAIPEIAPQGEQATVMTLDEVLKRAVERPLARAADRRADAAAQDATTLQRRLRWPGVQVDAALVRRDRDYLFATPLGDFALGERTSSSASLSLAQPILDPAQRFHALPAARREAAAATLEAERLRQRLVAEAADRFLDVLAIDARQHATEAFLSSLEARLQEVGEQIDAGRALEADGLKIELERDAARLDLTTLRMTRGVLTRELGRVAGHPGPVEPRFDGPHDRALPLDPETLIRTAQQNRPDLLALEEQSRALAQRAAAERATVWPRLEAGAGWYLADGDPLRPEEIVEGSLRLRWTPFQSRTRRSRSAALDARAEALALDLEAGKRQVAIDVQTAIARLGQARAAVGVRRSGVELARETLRVERERASAGRATTNDLLDAEAALRRQQTDHALARIEVLRAWIGLDLATGDDAFYRGPGSGGDSR